MMKNCLMSSAAICNRKSCFVFHRLYTGTQNDVWEKFDITVHTDNKYLCHYLHRSPIAGFKGNTHHSNMEF